MKNLEEITEKVTDVATESMQKEIIASSIITENKGLTNSENDLYYQYLFEAWENSEDLMIEYYQVLSQEAIEEEMYHRQYCEDAYGYDYEHRHQVEEDELYPTYGLSVNIWTPSLTQSLTQQKY